ncbi:MAG: AtpZ/AtpI family protein [bacterium]|nr:AtpZ/AtpI family protein [bacterium]
MPLLPKDEISRKYMLLGFKITGDFGATIAVPVVLFVVIAQWLEGKYGHGPWLTIIAFLLATLVTAKMIIKKAKQYGEEYQALGDDKDTRDKQQDTNKFQQ